MARITLTWVIAGIVVVLLTVVVMQNSRFDGSDATGTDTPIREYGGLENMPLRSETGANGVGNDVPATTATNHGPRGEHDNESGGEGEDPPSIDAMTASERDSTNFEDANKAKDAFQISGRGTRGFDRELLVESGFDETEIDRIAQGMRDYAMWLRNSSGGEFPAPPIKLSPEERDSRRQTRQGFLSDEEYAAALFATGQKNAAVFANAKEGSEAWDAGIRTGNRLVRINGVSIFDLMDFADGRDQKVAGELHVLEVLQGGERTTITVPCCRPGWGPVDMTVSNPSDVGSAE